MKKILFSVYITFFGSINLCSAELPSPYDTVDLLPYNGHGWYANAKSMESLIKSNDVKLVVEVGCWLGLSTRHIAKNLPEEGVVYAVDHWLGSPNEDNNSYGVDMDNLYRQFLSNTIHENLANKIIPLRMSSEEAANILEIKPDLVYIDATHDFDNVFKDLNLWFPFVKGHGIICGDDYFWGSDWPVKAAVDLFAQLNNLTIHNDGWFWYAEENEN